MIAWCVWRSTSEGTTHSIHRRSCVGDTTGDSKLFRSSKRFILLDIDIGDNQDQIIVSVHMMSASSRDLKYGQVLLEIDDDRGVLLWH